MINSTLVKKLEPEYVVCEFGDRRSYNTQGRLQSFYDCPSLIYSDGTKYWHKNGKIHRDNNLPAILWGDVDKEWWIDGKRIRSEFV
jgi:hypothetical protein